MFKADFAVLCNNRDEIEEDNAFRVLETAFMDERDFFDERREKKIARLNCPHCQQPNDYELNWAVRTKKKQLPRGADERDRAKFAKLQSYMVRQDDLMMCKNLRCRKRFEVSGVQSVVFLGETAAGASAVPFDPENFGNR